MILNFIIKLSNTSMRIALRKHFSKKNEEQEDIIILFNYEE